MISNVEYNFGLEQVLHDYSNLESNFGLEQVLHDHSAGKRDRDLTPSPYNAWWPEGPRAPLSERSEL